MRLDRRTFLKQAALALVSVGGAETGINLLSQNSRFAQWLKPYVETLAQTTNRKLALLIGVDEYSEKARLQGCVNDVELQKELLIERFGFKPQDIYTLTNRKATRENIETAFLEHLVEQATSDDVVLFHFSGYGSQVKISHDADTTQYQLINSLVPIDGIISTKGNLTANDLLQDTLTYLGRSLKTDNLITVLDTSFQTTKEILQGNYRVRSYSEVGERPSSEERAFLSQLARKVDRGIGGYLKTTGSPGILLSAAEQNQIALEGTWDNFSAGLLTYALTKYLWQTTPKTNIQLALQQTANSVSSWSEKQQQPKAIGKIKTDFVSNTLARQSRGGEGFIADLDSKGTFNLRLTALPLTLLDTYREESCFTIAEDGDSSTKSLLQLRSREGITAKAQLLESTNETDKNALVGKSVREAIRVLPHNLQLSVALDSHLERIERVDATSALANIPSVKAVAIAGEAYADCLLGKISLMTDKQADDPHDTENPSHSYGLYTSKGKLIANTSGEANEVVKLAVSRLEPYLSQLLAVKWLDAIVNENSSTIPVSATLESAQRNSTLLAKTSLRVANNPDFNLDIPTLNRNSEIRLKIENKSDRDLYGIIVGVDSNEKFTIFNAPQQSVATEPNVILNNLKISTRDRLTIPPLSAGEKWKIDRPLGIAKIYLIMAVKPFTNTLNLISRQPNAKLDEAQFINLSDSLAVSQSIVRDLHDSSNVSLDILYSHADVYALDVNNWLCFQFLYNVV